MNYEPLNPCAECFEMPAAWDGLCNSCRARLKANEDFDLEPEDWPDEAASDHRQAEWESYRFGDK